MDLSDLKNEDNYNKNVCEYQEFILFDTIHINQINNETLILKGLDGEETYSFIM
jgi:hypothetical protein